MSRRIRREIKNRDKKKAEDNPYWLEYKEYVRAIVRKEIVEELKTFEQWVKHKQKNA